MKLARTGGPRPSDLIDNFSLANALRAGVAAGGGPELLVHLAALAHEAGVAGFDQMIQVLAPETPEVAPEWLREHGVPALLSSLGDTLHDIPTVTGSIKEKLPPRRRHLDEHARLVFVRARASGAEAVCRVRRGVTEVAGECRVFGSEEDAVSAVHNGEVGEGAILVVGGCGPRGGPGLLRFDGLGQSLQEAGLEVPVLTDGLAPRDAVGTWISLFTPEATEGSVIGLLRDGDPLRIDLSEGRIRTGIGASELEKREPTRFPEPCRYGVRSPLRQDRASRSGRRWLRLTSCGCRFSRPDVQEASHDLRILQAGPLPDGFVARIWLAETLQN